MKFCVESPFQPAGGQGQAIELLTAGVENGLQEQVLLGVTGSGKTYTIAKVIERVQRPALILAHNKTLAAQICAELKSFFPNNAVEYFVSYYDYYRPEAYIPHTDTYLEKDSAVNEEIDRLRHSATASVAFRRDVIVVASVSCIYSLGSPIDYKNMVISLRPGLEMKRNDLLKKLVSIRYSRNDMAFERNAFRVRGDTVEIFPVYSRDTAVRVEFFGDEIEKVSEVDVVSGVPRSVVSHAAVYPASHYVTDPDNIQTAIRDIEDELWERIKYFEDNMKFAEAQRLKQRTLYDIEMLRELGFCSGIENYTRILGRRAPGATPHTLLDYFPEDFLLIADESHQTIPMVKAMPAGDYSRKKSLIDYGFRLPSAFDNRPLNFQEFNNKLNQVIYLSATPAKYEIERSGQIVEQLIRPTGLVDPEIFVRPTEGQIDDLLHEIHLRQEQGERVLITTLTRKMAEDLTAYMQKAGIRVRYMHHKVDTLERMELVRDLRKGIFDVLIGINLLREGLDLPEVSLVAVLDADKAGFLRSETALIQTIGRAARHIRGQVILYADATTAAMESAIKETERRRSRQIAFNREHGIVPKGVTKAIPDVLLVSQKNPSKWAKIKPGGSMTEKERAAIIEKLEKEMQNASKMLEFEYAAVLRDQIIELQTQH
ncbi:MAG: excinuclease ABC subunit UvrB [Oscillospiraceae bacterium]|nr:excinuclease ABC subunit UvrB [Oscillospiraceae bacterium]